ncbi:LuxR C-terminal-related transcriptional regulator [Streptomyces sp. NPDC056796]|uniref:LuxR C-terminal-related transcriptional regulator n=1 Tax=Streptomyces sp. NPDC056796 TaxID=3345947 RepID=UPI0036C82B01
MLESLGLTRREHDVYRALLQRPDWDLTAIAQRTGLTERGVRGALDRLTELSLLHSAAGAEGFIPVNPEIGITPLLQRIEAELDEQRARLSRDRAALAALASDYASLRLQAGSDGVERLDGVDAVRVRLREISQKATFSVRALMPGGTLSAAALDACKPLDEQTLARGVGMQTIYLDSVCNDQATVEYARWFSSKGGRTRTMPSLPMRLILCDHSAAVLPLDQDSSRGAYVIHLKSVVAALNELFDLIWDRATPLGENAAPSLAGPSERDLALLKMLEDGLTDEGISRKLGVSIRTVRRLMSDLMGRLGTQSRFQAGAEAVRRGWM